MSVGGRQPGAGRPLGRKNNSTIERETFANSRFKEALRKGISPLDMILMRMHKKPLPNGEEVDDDQLRCAIEAAPYLHSKLASTEVQLNSENTHFVMSDAPLSAEEWVTKYNIGVAASDNDAAVSNEGAAHPERKANGGAK